MQQHSLLTTKLYIPPVQPKLVARPHLIEQLAEGLRLGHRLTLVSAPAGFGKTTLLSEWLRQADRPVAWLSLDDGDNDPTRFLAYLVAALQGIDPAIGQTVEAALKSPEPPPLEPLLTSLVNDIAATPRGCFFPARPSATLRTRAASCHCQPRRPAAVPRPPARAEPVDRTAYR
jgi:LuxR family maltose regulon positive regulatory protein